MLIVPKFLSLMTQNPARKDGQGQPISIELLKFERAKPPGGNRVHLSLGEVILTVNVPTDAIGHGDAVFLLEALASAIRQEPPDQMALPGFSRADPKFATAEQRSAELPLGRAPAATPAPAPAPAPASAPDKNNPLAPPRGKKPKPGFIRFLVVGSDPRREIVLPANCLIRKWETSGDPNDTYTGEEFFEPWSPGESRTVAECTRVTYAGHLNTTNRALWFCDNEGLYPGHLDQWIHVQCLGKNPESLGDRPLTPAEETSTCTVCSRRIRRRSKEAPEPVQCEPCWLDWGRSSGVKEERVGDLLNPDEPRPLAQSEPAVSDQPFEPCYDCDYGIVIDNETDEMNCAHPKHEPKGFVRPCPDRRVSERA